MTSQNALSLISVFHSLFIVCLAFAVLFFVLAVVLFFVFKIPVIFDDAITGRAKKRKIEEMSARNADTGRLLARSSIPETSSSLSLSTKLTNIRSSTETAIQQKSFRAAAPTPPPYTPPQYDPPQYAPPKSEPAAPAGGEDTTLLAVGTDQTTVLSSGRQETSVLSTPLTTVPADRSVQEKPIEKPPVPEPVRPVEPAAVKEEKAPAPKQELPRVDVDVTSNSVVGTSSGPVEFDIGMGQTSQLTPDMLLAAEGEKTPAGRFEILEEKILIHTNEVIN